MTATVAIANLTADAKLSAQLVEQLERVAIQPLLCPDTDVRKAVRWAVALSPESTSACIIIDEDAAGVGAVTAALDPSIMVIVWAPAHTNLQRLAVALGKTEALVSVAESTVALVQPLLRALNTHTPGEDRPPAIESSPDQTDPEKLAKPAPPEPSLDDHSADLAMLQQLEQLMATARTNPVPQAQPDPIEIQQKGLDFSVPLRELMSAARLVAQEHRSREVLAIHYLAAILRQDNAYSKILEELGITDERVNAALAEHSSDDETVEPLINDGVFETVARAKDHARNAESDHVRVYDFLTGLFEHPTPAVESLLQVAQTDARSVASRLVEEGPITEPGGESFFKPSSRDQEGFYEFNEAEVKNITTRLRDLPAFQKAAKPNAPRRRERTQPLEKDQLQPTPMTLSAPEPPDEPEIFRVRGDFPPVDVVEQVADHLLEGHLVAFTSDIMLAVAADATNPAAVQSLRNLADLPTEKPLGVLINSTSQLKHLTRADLDSLEPLFDSTWPGPLTIIFEAARGLGPHVTHEGTIGVRLPGDTFSLSILSMLGRPLAATSWHEPIATLNGKVAAIVSAEGEQGMQQTTTVADVRSTPWKILRTGEVPADEVLKHQP